MKRFYIILTILISAILTACGGGDVGPENFIGPPDVLTPVRPNVLCTNPINCQ